MARTCALVVSRLKWQSPVWRVSCAALLGAGLVWGTIANAQVAGDGSLGTQVNGNPVAPCLAGTCLITGGIQTNGLQFHSFSQFSIPTGSEAVFDAAGARAIFARVTGGTVSAIDGRIATLAGGSVDLFLLNPNGVIFGPNAVLNTGGSFVASTANSVIFDNGAQFRATDRTFPPPLLTVTVPVGLQFGPNPAAIVVQGPGNNLGLNPDTFEIIRDFRSPGLEVSPGETLALIGGEIRLEGGNLIAPQGRAELGSVDSGSLVTLIPTDSGWRFDYAGVTQFRDIHLTQAAAVDASGNGGGEIQVQGRQVTLTGGSVLLTDTLGDAAGGNLTVRADSLELAGLSDLAPLYTGIFADAASTATNRGGNIFLQTGQLLIREGAQIGANTFGVGDAGTLTVKAQTIDIDGGSVLGPSGLSASVAPGAAGAGGSLTLEAQRLQLTNGAQVATTSFGFGATGTLTVKADEVTLAGVFTDPEFGERPSTLSADMLEAAIGQGGNLTIMTNQLRVSGGAQISSGTFGAGNAGAIAIQAQDIDLNGGSNSFVSGILAPVAPAATGQGGTLTLQTERLTVTEGAQIATTTFGLGDAGNVSIVASDSVRLTGQAPQGRSGIFAAAVSGPGAGGDLTVVTDRLIVENGATLSVSNFPSTANSPLTPGQGSAGDLRIFAQNILLNNQATLTADTVAGDRANIGLQTNLLVLRNGSRISTNAQGTASGGNIQIIAPNGFIVAVAGENSDITANAVQGNGGRVDITATGIYGIAVRPRLTPLSDITASSEFGIAGIVTLNTPYLETVRPLGQISDNPRVPPLLQGCQPGQGQSVGRFTAIGRGGARPQPTDSLGSRTILGDVSLPPQWTEPLSAASRGAAPAAVTPDQIVEAQGWIVNDRGEITLVAAPPTPVNPGECPHQLPLQHPVPLPQSHP